MPCRIEQNHEVRIARVLVLRQAASESQHLLGNGVGVFDDELEVRVQRHLRRGPRGGPVVQHCSEVKQDPPSVDVRLIGSSTSDPAAEQAT